MEKGGNLYRRRLNHCMDLTPNDTASGFDLIPSTARVKNTTMPETATATTPRSVNNKPIECALGSTSSGVIEANSKSTAANRAALPSVARSTANPPASAQTTAPAATIITGVRNFTQAMVCAAGSSNQRI